MGRRLYKLSSSFHMSGRQVTNQNLRKLRRLIDAGADIGETLSQIISKCRKVPAAYGEPFVFMESLDSNMRLLRTVFRDCDDVVFRHFTIYDHKALLVYVDELVDKQTIEKNILRPLMHRACDFTGDFDIHTIAKKNITSASLEVGQSVNDILQAVMAGNTLLLIDGKPDNIIINTEKYAKRGIQEPITEGVIRGPHEAFTEVIVDNIALVRRRTHDTNLKVRILHIGERSHTVVAVMYLANLVKPGLLEEVVRRLQRINIDTILLASTIEEMLIEHPWSPFPQIQTTERPDTFVKALYEGRVGIIVDNTPFAAIIPCTLSKLIQAIDDYTVQPIIACILRFTRLFSMFVGIYLPAIYVAIVSYHPGMLPTPLAISVAELRAKTPFPSLLEAILMEALLEMFQEGIVRLPKKISPAASIVGGIVIGTTVVQAGLFNPLLVVVIATTALASYTMVSHNFGLALRWLRIPMLLLASFLGLYGVTLGILAITVHMCSLKNFGEAYLGGFLDVTLIEDWKDSILRFPQKLISSTAKEFGAQDRKRMDGPHD